MFFTADQLVAHAIGDYVIQSHWMANEKTKKVIPAVIHVLTYGIPFLFITRSIPALAVIVGTHFAIDHWRLARHFIWLKNFLAPKQFFSKTEDMYEIEDEQGNKGLQWDLYLSRNRRWTECRATGFPPETPIWMSFWLMVIVDNILHVSINAMALNWLT